MGEDEQKMEGERGNSCPNNSQINVFSIFSKPSSGIGKNPVKKTGKKMVFKKQESDNAKIDSFFDKKSVTYPKVVNNNEEKETKTKQTNKLAVPVAIGEVSEKEGGGRGFESGQCDQLEKGD